MLIPRHRKFNRATWKYLYRRARIVQRELSKVWIDQLLYGQGFYDYDDEDLPRHKPIEDVILHDSKSPPPAPSSDPSDSQSGGPRS